MEQIDEQLGCSPFQNRAAIDLVNILSANANFISISPRSAFLSSHTIKNYDLNIIVSG